MSAEDTEPDSSLLDNFVRICCSLSKWLQNYDCGDGLLSERNRTKEIKI